MDDEPFEYEITEGRQRIIKRPRLTRILDASKARVLMLIAPAGYGKTTLARQWTADRAGPFAWYTGGPASADVAALCVELAEAVQPLLPGAGIRLRERLSITDAPEQEVGVLAELLAEDLEAWPADAILVFDDYHYAMERPAAERFVELLLELSPIRLLLASRNRPVWATARRCLAGDTDEVMTNDLAMTLSEAHAIVDSAGSASPWLDHANGWPAVIALASLVADDLPPRILPPALFDYFAEEMFRNTREDLRQALMWLSVGETVDFELCAFLFGARASRLVDDALSAGFLTRQVDRFLTLHPLLRAFLRAKLAESPTDVVERAEDAALSFYIPCGRWDDAFVVVKQANREDRLLTLFERALEALLSTGRLATLQEWLAFAASRSLEGPILQLAQAHVDQRQGRSERAELLALSSTHGLVDLRLKANALRVAALSAEFAERPADALAHLEHARNFAEDRSQRREIAWSAFCAAMETDIARAQIFFEEFESLTDHSLDTLLRVAHGHLVLATHLGGLKHTVTRYSTILDMVPAASNPVRRTAYLNCLANALILLARYDEAQMVSGSLLSDATSSDLLFVLPYAWLHSGVASCGSRNFRSAHNALDKARLFGERTSNAHAVTCCNVALAGLLLAEGATSAALDATREGSIRATNVTATAELEAVHALALTTAAKFDEAREALDQADARCRDIEVSGRTTWTRAALALRRDDPSSDALVGAAVNHSRRTGNLNAFVTVYRTYPPLLGAAAAHFGDAALGEIVHSSNDHSLARVAGLTFPTREKKHGDGLTRRELEVYELLVAGRSNQEIAKALFISPTTVKAHINHIYGKLGVNSRTQAVAKRSRVVGD